MAMLTVVAPAPAVAQSSTTVTREQIFDTIGLDQLPGDYVLSVDSSRSMKDAGLYAPVKRAVRSFFGALATIDNLSLITFDVVPTIRYSGAVGTPRTRLFLRYVASAWAGGLIKWESTDPVAKTGQWVLTNNGSQAVLGPEPDFADLLARLVRGQDHSSRAGREAITIAGRDRSKLATSADELRQLLKDSGADLPQALRVAGGTARLTRETG